MITPNFQDNSKDKLKIEIYRYLSFWPIILVFLILSLLSAFFYIRYAEKIYYSSAIIEIVDKAQDSEMALPTSMTIFNRSMINLENEFGRLNSFKLNSEVVSSLKSNVRFYNIGDIKTTEIHREDFFNDFDLEFLIDTDMINEYSFFEIQIDNDVLTINKFINDNFEKKYTFKAKDTNEANHDLPFNLRVNDSGINKDNIKRISFYPFKSTVDLFRNNLNTSQFSFSNSSSNGSDQIKLGITGTNTFIIDEYLSKLIYMFDQDGIKDRQFEYKNTIDFVEDRSDFLKNEVVLLEKRKQDFKKENRLTDIKSDATITIDRQYFYDENLFELKTQIDLVKILLDELDNNDYGLLPINFGLNNENLNTLINQYNILVNERSSLISMGAGIQNRVVKNVESKVDVLYENILKSVKSLKSSLEISIQNYNDKEMEFEKFYSDIPFKERLLREIERELIVKEALYSLMLQKKEEAAINFAVIKPSIKLIDAPRSQLNPIEPNKTNILILSIFVGLLAPISILYIWFFFDDKIHIASHLESLNVPVLTTIPYTDNFNNFKDLSLINSSTREPIAESIRMLIANMKYYFTESEKIIKTILVTSSIKGEGKTTVSTLLSKLLSFDKDSKVILIGSDLRNPQIHTYLNIDRNIPGLSNYLFKKDLDWRDLLIKNDDLDILLSGTIPPNPNEMLSSKKFKDLIDELKLIYDYVIIDSAPCLLVADTLNYSSVADLSILVARANHTSKNLIPFIENIVKENKLKNTTLILNSVGKSQNYGYKYVYNYYYNYGYNYGYGSSDEKPT